MSILTVGEVKLRSHYKKTCMIDRTENYHRPLCRSVKEIIRVYTKVRVLVCFHTGNIALGRPTFQSSTAYGGVSSNAVDGDRNNTFYTGRSCTHTMPSTNPWWAVDLQWSLLVGEVNITNRAENKGELFTHYYLKQ